MLRRIFNLPILVGALLLLTPALGDAAPHGGGHAGGGFHGGGGFHAGGGYHAGGGFHGGNVGAAHFGGYRGGFNHGGYNRGGLYGHPYGRYGYGHYYSGYYPYFGGYSAYPYFDYPAVDDSGAYAQPGPTLDPGLYSDADVTPSDSGAYFSAAPLPGGLPPVAAPETTPPDERAHFTVTVPAGAQLWVDDTPTTAAGTVRVFQSPPLASGRQYAYTMRVRWDDNGHEQNQVQRVEFAAGDHINVQFPVSPAPGGPVPAGTHG
jgi:uncharacterized protein (TIGR03000 family)